MFRASQGIRDLSGHLSQRADGVAIDFTAGRIRLPGIQEVFDSEQAIEHIGS